MINTIFVAILTLLTFAPVAMITDDRERDEQYKRIRKHQRTQRKYQRIIAKRQYR